jgi:Heliorhodopsin
MATQSTKSKAKSTSKKTAAKAVKSTKKPTTKTTKTAKAATKSAVKTKAVAKSKKPAAKKVADAQAAKKQKFAFLKKRTVLKSEKVTKIPSYSWNGWLALLYAVQGAIILVASKTAASVPITVSYLANDSLLSKVENDAVFSPAVQHLFDLDLSYAVAGLLFVLALAHAIAALRRRSYEAAVDTASSTFRWVTSFLALGGSVLLVAILVGVQDIVGLLLLTAFVATSSFVALLAERLVRDRSGVIHKTFLYRVHFAAYFVPIAALAVYLMASSMYDGTLPAYVNYLFASVVVLSFFLTSILRMQLAAEKKWSDYAYAEKAYLITAFVLVSATAWQIFASVLK